MYITSILKRNGKGGRIKNKQQEICLFTANKNVVDPVIIRWIISIYFFIYSIYCIPIINKIYNELIGE